MATKLDRHLHVKQRQLTDLRGTASARRVSRVLLEPRLADLFRRLCRHLRRPASAVFEDMLLLYVQERTTLEPVFAETQGPVGSSARRNAPQPAEK